MKVDDQITLRDKIVLSLLDGYLNGNGINTQDDIVKNALLDPNKHTDMFLKIEKRIRAAYKMADLIRKIRLESFT